MNLLTTLSLFSTLAIGTIPAYLIAKAQKTNRKGQGEFSNGNYIRQCSREIFKGLENGEGSCVLRRVRHQRQPLDESLTSSDGLSL